MRTKMTSEYAGYDVLCWRIDQLVHTGFALLLVAVLAKDARYDLHALTELVEQGCQPDLAARILAPLEDEIAA